MIKNGGFPFSVYTILYNACVTSIADYASEVTGFSEHESTLNVHLRAIRAFLGLPKNSCNFGALSEVDWLLPVHRTRIRMIRQYWRMLHMDDTRLTKKVLNWDRRLNDLEMLENWSWEVKKIFRDCQLEDVYTAREFHLSSTLANIKEKMDYNQKMKYQEECLKMPKLRTFMTFKVFGSLPAYVSKPLMFTQRRVLGKLQLGCLELRIETGRYNRPRLPIHERSCQICSWPGGFHPIETEYHFLFLCPVYKAIRNEWLQKMSLPDNFLSLPDHSKFKIVLNSPNNVKATANYVLEALQMRNNALI